jgi:hypothetical protein
MPSDNRVRARITLSGVRDAYSRGEFERVLMMADALQPRDAIDAIDMGLLRARALLALNRSEEALGALRALQLVERPRDEYLTAQMLTGAAFSKLDQNARSTATSPCCAAHGSRVAETRSCRKRCAGLLIRGEVAVRRFQGRNVPFDLLPFEFRHIGDELGGVPGPRYGNLTALEHVKIAHFLFGPDENGNEALADQVQILQEPRRPPVSVDERMNREQVEV